MGRHRRIFTVGRTLFVRERTRGLVPGTRLRDYPAVIWQWTACPITYLIAIRIARAIVNETIGPERHRK